VHVESTGCCPRPPVLSDESPGHVTGESQFDQVVRSGSVSLPLPPQDGPQFPPKPAVQFLEDRRIARKMEVIHPPAKLRIRLLDGLGHAPTPSVFADFPQGILEFGYRFLSHLPRWDIVLSSFDIWRVAPFIFPVH